MEAPALELFRGDDSTPVTLPVRGVGWVLKWAATFAVLVVSAAILTSFAYQLAAERTLAHAAAAGLREAALPRASSRSVEAVVRQQLASHQQLDRATTVHLEQNESPLNGVVRARNGDQLSLTLSAPAAAVMPRWLPIAAWGQRRRSQLSDRSPGGIDNAVASRPTPRPAGPFGL